MSEALKEKLEFHMEHDDKVDSIKVKEQIKKDELKKKKEDD